MPELPEVETIKEDLKKKILNTCITKVEVYDSRVIRNCSLRIFNQSIKNKLISQVLRRGKAMIFKFNDGVGYLVIQPMMTGQLILAKKNVTTKFTKLTFELSNDQYLHYNDQRLFGRIQVVSDLKEIKYFCTLGPDPLSEDFHIEWLEGELKKRTMPIKSLLMNQNIISGIGNIYASEILFRSGINPRRPALSLNKKEITALYRATQAILKEAIRFRGTSMMNYRDGKGHRGRFLDRIKVYGRENEHCFRCEGLIQRLVLSGRSTFYCQNCQS